MAKTLFISDLDGTLFDKSGHLTDYTVNAVNELIGRGMYFTYATARTVYSAQPLTQQLKVNIPCILNNGAEVYDTVNGEYVKNAYIRQDPAESIVRAFRENGLSCFVFKFIDGKLATCYDDVTSPVMQQYIEERAGKFNQPFVKCDDVAKELDGTAVYINAVYTRERLQPVRDKVLTIPGADCAFYEDTYTKWWYLETFSSEASKANGIKFLREKYGFDRVVCFGDNLNDLSMFSQCDVKIAVGNAAEEVKAAADIVIGRNDEDGAAKWLTENFEQLIK